MRAGLDRHFLSTAQGFARRHHGIDAAAPSEFAAKDQNGKSRGFNTPDKKVAVYSLSFAAHGFAPLPEYIEPMISPISRPDIAGEYPLVLTNAKFNRSRGPASIATT